jgi:uncharacterized Zn finger protein
MSDGDWTPYVPVAQRRKKSAAAAAKAKQAGAPLAPIAAFRGAIARTFWGKAWCDNLERYSDYANRLPRGRTYVRNGSVIDLAIAPGAVRARVMGTRSYRVEVQVAAVAAGRWQAIAAACAGSIDSMVELLQGKFSAAVMQRLCRPGDGLLPTPREIAFRCSCPDWAAMCKHVAAVLYGVGARLDERPELLFRLRKVDEKELIAVAGRDLPLSRKGPAADKVLAADDLSALFGVEIAAPGEQEPEAPPAERNKPRARRAAKPRKASAGTPPERRPKKESPSRAEERASKERAKPKKKTGPKKKAGSEKNPAPKGRAAKSKDSKR